MYYNENMLKLIANWILSALAIIVTAYLVPGVRVDSFTTALIVAIVLGIVNAVLKPLLVILTLPITLISLGLFMFVINAVMVLVVDRLVPGFGVNSFITALLFSLVLSVVNWFLFRLVKE